MMVLGKLTKHVSVLNSEFTVKMNTKIGSAVKYYFRPTSGAVHNLILTHKRARVYC